MNDLELFRGWSSSNVDWLLQTAVPETHIAHTLVVAEGQEPQAIYIVSHGLYQAYLGLGTTGQIELSRMGGGAVFGEMAWLGNTVASASVRAIETSEVLALPVRLLEQKLRDDLIFAAEFMGSLARMLRVRLVNLSGLYMREKELSSAPAVSGNSSGMHDALISFKAQAARCEKEQRSKEGLSIEAEKLFQTSFVSLVADMEVSIRSLESNNPSAAAAVGAFMQAEILPYLLSTQAALRFYSKPRGYAGDFMSIEWMYDDIYGGANELGRLLDRMFTKMPPVRAVRNRRALLAGRIVSSVQRHGAATGIMSLACGPAREVFDAFSLLPPEQWPRATLLDIDAEALTLVGERSRELGLDQTVDLVQGNLMRLALGREELKIPPQHLIYSIGLIDYFNDEFVVALLHWIYERLALGGEVILGNFHPCNPAKALMDYVLEWKLIHRSEDDMRRLFAASPFGVCSEIVFEEEQINLFAVGVRK